MIRNVVTLLTGNTFAQIVNVVTIVFIVSTFFSPSEFGRYAVVMSYVGILSSVACFRYELAIVSVTQKRQANNMVFASITIATVFSLLVFAAFALLSATIDNELFLGTSPLMIAGLVYLRAIDQIVASIFFRQEAYKQYSLLKLLQAIVLAIGFFVAGKRGADFSGLLWSTVFAYVSFALVGALVTGQYDMRSGVRRQRMGALVRRHSDFAKFNAPQALIDNFLANGLNLILAVFAGPAVVGYFSYMQRTVKAPLGLIFGAVSQVVFRFSAKNVSNSALVTKKLRQVFAVVVGILAASAFGIMLVYVFFEDLKFLRGWIEMKDYMIAFAVWMLVPFLFSPYATLPVVYGRQKQFFQLATTFNVVSLLILTLLIWNGAVASAFLLVGVVSIVYYAGANAWLYRVVSSG